MWHILICFDRTQMIEIIVPDTWAGDTYLVKQSKSQMHFVY